MGVRRREELAAAASWCGAREREGSSTLPPCCEEAEVEAVEVLQTFIDYFIEG